MKRIVLLGNVLKKCARTQGCPPWRRASLRSEALATQPKCPEYTPHISRELDDGMPALQIRQSIAIARKQTNHEGMAVANEKKSADFLLVGTNGSALRTLTNLQFDLMPRHLACQYCPR